MTSATEAVYWRLRKMIAAQQLVPGDRVGTERELAQHLGVGRGLLRQALLELQSQNRIRRIIGRNGGIVVSDGRIERNLNTISGVPTLLKKQGFVSSTKVITAGSTLAGEEVARALAIDSGDPVFGLVRIRYADRIPLSLERSYLPAAIFPNLLHHPLESLYSLLQSKYDCVLSSTEEDIVGRSANAAEIEHLSMADKSVVLEIRRISTDRLGRRVEYAVDVFRSERIRVTVTADRVASISHHRVAGGTGSRPTTQTRR